MQNASDVPEVAREYFVIPDDYVWVPDGERVNTENGHWIDTGFFYPNEENPANITVLDKSKFTKLSCNRIPFNNKITVEKLPYSLSPLDFPSSYDTDKLLQLAQLLNHSLSKGTIVNYTSVVKKFREHFLFHNPGALFYNFTSDHLLSWILHLQAIEVPFSFWCKVQPAIEHLQKVINKESIITKQISVCLQGGKRISAPKKRLVEKGIPIPPAVLKAGIAKYIQPFYDKDINQIPGDKFRSLYKELIKAQCLCRFNDYDNLQARHFTDHGDSISIKFVGGKTDFYWMGDRNIIKDDDSDFSFVKITRLYFKRFSLHFSNSGIVDYNFINFQLRVIQDSTGANIQCADGRVSLSRNQSREDSKKFLAGLNFVEKYSEKGAKMTGVGLAHDANGSMTQIRDLGRWADVTMPQHYLKVSAKYKKDIYELSKLR